MTKRILLSLALAAALAACQTTKPHCDSTKACPMKNGKTCAMKKQ